MSVQWALLSVSMTVSILTEATTVLAAGGTCQWVLATAQVCYIPAVILSV